MNTILELEKHLEEEGYSFQAITIGKHHAPEGIIIEKEGDQYLYAYSERGNKRILQSFSKEEDLVTYAWEQLNSDKWMKAHLVAWVWSEEAITKAEAELTSMNIKFERNDIPTYAKGKRAYRIFVFGNDVLRLAEFKRTYWEY